MIWKIFSRNGIFLLALTFSLLLHTVVPIILIHVRQKDEKYLNLTQFVIQSAPRRKEIEPVLKEPEDRALTAKKFETNTNTVVITNKPIPVKVEGGGEDNLSGYIAIKSAPQFVTPLYSLIVYPEFEKENHVEGEVIYEVYLKSNGEIKAINILKATTKAMGDAVLAALGQEKMIPPYGADGKPFACRFRQRLPFRLIQNG
jgi:TonB family protein